MEQCWTNNAEDHHRGHEATVTELMQAAQPQHTLRSVRAPTMQLFKSCTMQEHVVSKQCQSSADIDHVR